jgi:hypothetical protein
MVPVDDNPNGLLALFGVAVSLVLLVAQHLKDLAVSGWSKRTS